MNDAEIFSQMMDDLAAELGMTLRVGEAGTEWSVPLLPGGVTVGVSYREKTGYVFVCAPVELLEDVDYREPRARTLLSMTAFGAQTAGFTLALDPDTHDLVALGRRPARRIEDASSLAHWLADLAELVYGLRLALTDIETSMALGADAAADGAGEVRT